MKSLYHLLFGGTRATARHVRYSSLPQQHGNHVECKEPAAGVKRRSKRRLLLLMLLSALLSPVFGYMAWSWHVGETFASACAAEKHLVVASTTSQDVAWLEQVPSEWSVKRYMMDDLHPDPAVGLAVPRLYGREAMAYLTYIIDHYDCLPAYAVFVHGHERSWHQVTPLAAKIRALNLTALSRERYISFRCEDNMGCERLPYIDTANVNWDGERHMNDFFQHILPHETPPRHVSYKCCGQHAVTAAAVRRRSKQDWIRIREPLLMDEADMVAQHVWASDPPVNEWLLGTWYEKYWHVFFGMDSQHCPSLEQCRRVHFSNAVVCDGDTDLVPYEGDTWRGVECRTAFDGLPRDQQPDWDQWFQDLPGLSGAMRKARAERTQAAKDRLDELEKLVGSRREL